MPLLLYALKSFRRNILTHSSCAAWCGDFAFFCKLSRALHTSPLENMYYLHYANNRKLQRAHLLLIEFSPDSVPVCSCIAVHRLTKKPRTRFSPGEVLQGL